MASVMPEHATWLRQAAASFQPASNQITLADGSTITYKVLIVAPGIRLAWEKIDGLESTLGKNGVQSNYPYDLAPYNRETVRQIGRASGRDRVGQFGWIPVGAGT